jgi:hypothetical protein
VALAALGTTQLNTSRYAVRVLCALHLSLFREPSERNQAEPAATAGHLAGGAYWPFGEQVPQCTTNARGAIILAARPFRRMLNRIRHDDMIRTQ